MKTKTFDTKRGEKHMYCRVNAPGKRLRAFALTLLLLTGILAGYAGSSSPTSLKQPRPASQSSIPVIPITAVDYSYIMPSTLDVRTGLVDIAMVDNGTQPHQTQLALLKPGVTPQQVTDEFFRKRDQAAAFSLLILVGGPDIISPGYGQETILNLSSGRYVLLCLVVGQDGIAHISKGMIHFFTVEPTAMHRQEHSPQADGEVVMRDGGYVLPGVIAQARALTLYVKNQGTEAHEFNIVKLAPGRSIQDIVSFFQSPSGPPPFEEEGGMAALSAGGSGWIKTHLEPGTYAAFSFIPDQRTGKPQLTQGTITQFTVQ
jgi:hypothetical protein